HPYLQQPKLLAACASMGVALTAYSPLGSPDSATMFGREDGVRLTEHPTIQEVASRRGATPGQVLIAWGLDRGTAVIPKSVNPSRIKENLGAEDVVLDDEDRTAIAALNADRRMLDASFWFVGDDYDAESFWAE
ncbi:MAG: aldo/keto reductase, partial [Myxococcota bacterium]